MSNSLFTMDSYYPDYQQPIAPEAPFNPEVFHYERYGEHYSPHRSKTPTSLVNHTGLSPGGPLSTPPMSRDASRGPEPPPSGQYPEQIVDYGSQSNSPTSVRTPDNDLFEVEMLDTHSLREFYQDNGNIMTTQVTQGPLSAVDNNMFLTPQGNISDQAIHQAFNATMAARSQQFQTPQFPVQTELQQSPISPLHYHNYIDQTFPQQTAPWTSEQPPRNPNEPCSGISLFDPVTDNEDYSQFINPVVNFWRMNHTDPDYLVSPNEPVVPPQDHFSMAPQTRIQHIRPSQLIQHQGHAHNQTYIPNSSPIEMRVHRALPAADSHNFVNYDSTSPLFTENYTTAPHGQPSPIATSIELPMRINLQSPASPLTSASSPGGSEGMFSSYQQSDPGMDHVEPYAQQSFNHIIPSPPSIEVTLSPSRSFPEQPFGVSPDPEGPRRQVGPIRSTGKPGGRALGTHLEPKVAKAAHDMRKIVACWHCALQRDKCGPGDVCDRCLKRAQRPNADCGLGCSRIKLIELSDYFLPTVVMHIHEDSHLTHFVSQFIHQWSNQEIDIYMTCEQRTMPRIQVKVYEFAPRGQELLTQIQYQTDQHTMERFQIRKTSPALGMVHINHHEEKKYDKYLNDIVDNHLDAFANICWAEDDNDFAPRLFKLMTRVKPKSDDEAKLLREVFRLIVCTYIMSHTLTIAEETKTQTLSKMHSYTDPSAYVQNYTSPRMAARQLKYFFARLQRATLGHVLNKLQQIFSSSRGCDKWLAAFVAVVGMAMAHEDQQKTIHQVMATRAVTERFDPRDAQSQADIANREVDQRMNFISQIFRWKYNRKCNPLRDCDIDWEKEAGFGDESSVTFVRSVAQLVKENRHYLQQRQSISISPANQGKYTARLVAPFLLSFWLPQ